MLPEHSAAAIGSSVVLRVYGGGLGGVSISVTTIPFATSDDAANWIAENRTDIRYTSQLPEPAP